MKKLIAFVLMLIYFTVSTGFTVSMHYCMDKLDSAQIGTSEKEECGNCGMEVSDSNGCCRSETKLVKLQQDQTQAFFTLINFTLTPALTSTQNYISSHFINTEVEITSNSAHAPPLIGKQHTYLLNCVFRI